MRIGIVFGTRPEIIKVATVYLKAKELGVDTDFICTGQHREMVDMMKGIFGVESDIDMNIMTANQTLNDVMYKVVHGFEELFKERKYDWIFVQGDTTTAMAAALASFNKGVKVGHIEAGLRSGDLYDPFPEEMNRRVIDQVSEKMFAPTEKSKATLLKEGFDESRILVTGNTVIDAQMYVVEHFDLDKERKRIFEDGDYFLVTLHRRENIGERMRNILKALRKFAESEKIHLVFPVHKNPKVREIVYSELDGCKYAKLTEPVDYVQLTALLKGAKFVATDSGGIQEEAPTFGKFVVVCRETTERPELIESGFGVLAGTQTDGVLNAMYKAFEFQPGELKNPFGDGHASERIIRSVMK
ncbi:MAG: UDP-N-acetylglucosamine 2-epimerase (non-hydrolyzing) [Fervidobacterium sp.]|uniref:UDP-N-acetylglucosamine 2-epimerase (non-hydrolyzing) n=1 Tax=Fervidobacterium gondwanense DSM 13020 TaxID=1121883 RepID=A0A1M7RSN6_FERGO|nr:UDP-N-acetylglucosamine 2-epimerase (non-hydrolyzing) [Fervidobacterium gondwanense]UXF00305.1 UDP-N-acetylglucosamine 2-epimerase [Fervidobacterium riparium]SHN49088.1 UDP-N-acetylglucosamine 2-epimerase (non-hydrolysing) [Fervidobacterium gondwanense DSM 13020]